MKFYLSEEKYLLWITNGKGFLQAKHIPLTFFEYIKYKLKGVGCYVSE